MKQRNAVPPKSAWLGSLSELNQRIVAMLAEGDLTVHDQREMALAIRRSGGDDQLVARLRSELKGEIERLVPKIERLNALGEVRKVRELYASATGVSSTTAICVLRKYEDERVLNGMRFPEHPYVNLIWPELGWAIKPNIYDSVRDLAVTDGRKIEGIKLVRALTGLGLKEAKEFTEIVMADVNGKKRAEVSGILEVEASSAMSALGVEIPSAGEQPALMVSLNLMLNLSDVDQTMSTLVRLLGADVVKAALDRVVE